MHSNDEDFYLEATVEVDSENQRPALWAKCMALALGDENGAKYRYIYARVNEQLTANGMPIQREHAYPDILSAQSQAYQNTAAEQLANLSIHRPDIRLASDSDSSAQGTNSSVAPTQQLVSGGTATNQDQIAQLMESGERVPVVTETEYAPTHRYHSGKRRKRTSTDEQRSAPEVNPHSGFRRFLGFLVLLTGLTGLAASALTLTNMQFDQGYTLPAIVGVIALLSLIVLIAGWKETAASGFAKLGTALAGLLLLLTPLVGLEAVYKHIPVEFTSLVNLPAYLKSTGTTAGLLIIGLLLLYMGISGYNRSESYSE